jgi:hypothetical protein
MVPARTAITELAAVRSAIDMTSWGQSIDPPRRDSDTTDIENADRGPGDSQSANTTGAAGERQRVRVRARRTC